MSLFGGLSKAERARIQRRVRNAMQTMARAGGRYLGGRPPYGYRLVPVSPHPNAEKARIGATLEPARARSRDRAGRPTDLRRAARRRGLLRDRPAASTPKASRHRRNTIRARNSHRNGPGWADSAVRAILRNARYTGHEVFGRQRRDYELIDLSSPAEGHVRRMRWNDPLIVDLVTRTHARSTRLPRGLDACPSGERAGETARAEGRRRGPTSLRGRVFCASCGRRMHGQTRSGTRRYYRCAARARYPGIADAHPRDVLVREQPIIDALDEWLERALRARTAQPRPLKRSSRARPRPRPKRTHRSGPPTHLRRAPRGRTVPSRPARRQLASPPDARSLSWLDEAAAEKEQAELALTAAMQLAPPSLSVEEILAVVEHCGGLTGVLHQATDEERAALYDAIGVSAVYNPERNEVRLGVDPVASTACRRGDLNPHAPKGTSPSS